MIMSVGGTVDDNVSRSRVVGVVSRRHSDDVGRRGLSKRCCQ